MAHKGWPWTVQETSMSRTRGTIRFARLLRAGWSARWPGSLAVPTALMVADPTPNFTDRKAWRWIAAEMFMSPIPGTIRSEKSRLEARSARWLDWQATLAASMAPTAPRGFIGQREWRWT